MLRKKSSGQGHGAVKLCVVLGEHLRRSSPVEVVIGSCKMFVNAEHFMRLGQETSRFETGRVDP